MVYLQLLYAVLCLLPLGWLLGVLAPLDALLPWLMEQTLVHLIGGSPLATDLRYNWSNNHHKLNINCVMIKIQ